MSFDIKFKNGRLGLKNGDLEVVTKTNLLIQNILKGIITKKGANPMQAGYGTSLSNVISSGLDSDNIMSLLQNEVYNSLNLLQKVQTAQMNTYQELAPEELISVIKTVSATNSIYSPMQIDIRVDVLDKTLQKKSAFISVNSNPNY